MGYCVVSASDGAWPTGRAPPPVISIPLPCGLTFCPCDAIPHPHSASANLRIILSLLPGELSWKQLGSCVSYRVAPSSLSLIPAKGFWTFTGQPHH